MAAALFAYDVVVAHEYEEGDEEERACEGEWVDGLEEAYYEGCGPGEEGEEADVGDAAPALGFGVELLFEEIYALVVGLFGGLRWGWLDDGGLGGVCH